jgi:hypothetical protein
VGTKIVDWKPHKKLNGCCVKVSHTLVGRRWWVPQLHNGDRGWNVVVSSHTWEQRVNGVASHLFSHEQEIQNINLYQENPGKCLRDQKGVLVDFMPEGITTNAAAYCETVKRLWRTIHNRTRGMLTGSACLLHDSARVHTTKQCSSCCRVSTGKV